MSLEAASLVLSPAHCSAADTNDEKSESDFWRLWAINGIGTAASFAAMTGTSALTSEVGKGIFRSRENIFANPVINGAIAGVPVGLVNVQIESLFQKTNYRRHERNWTIRARNLDNGSGVWRHQTASARYFHEQNFSEFAQVRRAVLADKEAVRVLNDLHAEREHYAAQWARQSFREMNDFINSNPQEHPAVLAKMLNAGASGEMQTQ